MSDEEYFNEMMTSEETIPAIRYDQELRSKLLGILKEMDVTVAREICEDVLNQITTSSVFRSREPKKGDSFTAGWAMLVRDKDLQLTIRRDALIYKAHHTTLDDGRQVLKLDVSVEDVVNLLNQNTALIEVKGVLSGSGAEERSKELEDKYTELMSRPKILIPIKEEREDWSNSRYE